MTGFFHSFIPACINHSFPFIDEQYLILRIHHVLFICSSVDGHLSCFHFLAITQNGFNSLEFLPGNELAELHYNSV